MWPLLHPVRQTVSSVHCACNATTHSQVLSHKSYSFGDTPSKLWLPKVKMFRVSVEM